MGAFDFMDWPTMWPLKYALSSYMYGILFGPCSRLFAMNLVHFSVSIEIVLEALGGYRFVRCGLIEQTAEAIVVSTITYVFAFWAATSLYPLVKLEYMKHNRRGVKCEYTATADAIIHPKKVNPLTNISNTSWLISISLALLSFFSDGVFFFEMKSLILVSIAGLSKIFILCLFIFLQSNNTIIFPTSESAYGLLFVAIIGMLLIVVPFLFVPSMLNPYFASTLGIGSVLMISNTIQIIRACVARSRHRIRPTSPAISSSIREGKNIIKAKVEGNHPNVHSGSDSIDRMRKLRADVCEYTSEGAKKKLTSTDVKQSSTPRSEETSIRTDPSSTHSAPTSSISCQEDPRGSSVTTRSGQTYEDEVKNAEDEVDQEVLELRKKMRYMRAVMQGKDKDIVLKEFAKSEKKQTDQLHSPSLETKEMSKDSVGKDSVFDKRPCLIPANPISSSEFEESRVGMRMSESED
ncbi:hypothetical protein ADUPG1_009389 [Aduncisulcus paluster]|uniref:Uncharacterized protein n=1 Tax=Aduncisulcus paluster TaxID=2918883 RepID=A0ABQ5KVE5_9EUKA|nr:hypothetical protein ADUPG1_009389 [Aduncisulcus paluster]